MLRKNKRRLFQLILNNLKKLTQIKKFQALVLRRNHLFNSKNKSHSINSSHNKNHFMKKC